MRPVNAEEYEGTPTARVARRWAGYTTSIIEFNQLVRESLELVGPTLQVKDLLGAVTKTATDDQRRRWYSTTVRAKHLIDADYAALNRHILTAGWGAIESFIEDFCHAVLLMDRTLLQSDLFKNVRLGPAALLLDEDEQVDTILGDAYNRDSADLKVGVGKFETQLKYVDRCDEVRSGTTPVLRERIFYAQQFRNLIVHRGGVADKRFVERCSALSYSVGDSVSIGTDQLRKLLSGLVVYGLLIVNLDRDRHGLSPFPWPLITDDPELETPYKESWGHLHARTGWFTQPLPLFTQIEP